MKNFIKRIIPKKIKSIVTHFRNNKIVKNYFKTDYKKRALLSYITYPFKKNSMNHTNYYEVTAWASVLNELGYQVDIVQYNNCPYNLEIIKYDLICGFGDVFNIYMKTSLVKAKTIIYATGMHVSVQNTNTLKRLRDVYEKKGVWLGDSVRFVDKSWSFHSSFVDATIALGNEFCANSYIEYTSSSNVYKLDSLFFRIFDYNEIINRKFDDSQKHFLWFGSSGAIHKGLDLLLEYFATNSSITLHIAGSIDKEVDFTSVYYKELFETSNIIYHGFIDIKTNSFKNILKQCSFLIYPSCSEGGSPSVLTCIGNGGLFPIITKETTVDIPYKIWIDDFNIESIDIAIKQSLQIEKDKLISMMSQNAKKVNTTNSLEQYKINLKKILKGII